MFHQPKIPNIYSFGMSALIAAALNELIWCDQWEAVPLVLREKLDNAPWLTDEDRQKIYSECEEEFLNIDHYAAHKERR